MKLLLANIGNRNILYKDYIIRDILQSEKRSEILPPAYLSEVKVPDYRSFTRWLSDPVNFQRERENISSQIADKVIEKIQEELERIILFVTDQKGVKRNNQDTIYTGIILANHYKEKYKDIIVDQEILELPVIEMDRVLEWYRNKVKDLFRTFPDRHYVIVDSGGAYQLKFALKISCEYLLPREQFSTWYVSQTFINSSELIASENYEFRKIIDTIQCLKLHETLNYQASFDILQQIGHPHKELVRFALYRQSFQHVLCKKKKEKLLKEKEYSKLKFLKSYNNYSFANEQLENLIKKEHYQVLFELLSKIQKQIELKNLREVFVTSYSFIEYFLKAIIEGAINKPLITDYYKVRKEISGIDKHPGIGQMVKYIDKNDFKGKSIYRDFENTFKECLNQKDSKKFNVSPKKSLNGIRNSMAHDGTNISLQDFNNLPYRGVFDKWFQLFQLPETNIYDQMNKELTIFLK